MLFKIPDWREKCTVCKSIEERAIEREEIKLWQEGMTNAEEKGMGYGELK